MRVGEDCRSKRYHLGSDFSETTGTDMRAILAHEEQGLTVRLITVTTFDECARHQRRTLDYTVLKLRLHTAKQRGDSLLSPHILCHRLRLKYKPKPEHVGDLKPPPNPEGDNAADGVPEVVACQQRRYAGLLTLLAPQQSLELVLPNVPHRVHRATTAPGGAVRRRLAPS
ncbi:hypothetical protein AYO21_09150 [Fonsecaea monophora]|uniref:Uncharacterized protein n=1 Tax=Fonsecaea monophora TaxID=254056 RepID=A0A177EXB2_9EURO|nr:hypothetical protein AYO21_09150 [Fonsecaea monophora]OAG36675.1 hypothetical protein AYO21_09150 [Fonsecaea monophora]